MKLEFADVPAPGAGERLVRQHAASVDFHDIYVRSGSYSSLDLPGILGLEAVWETLLAASEKLFATIATDALLVTLGGRFDRAGAAKAHAALEARTAGPFVLDC